MAKVRWKILYIPGFVLVLFVIAYFLSPAYRQQRNMDIAEKYIPEVRQIIRSQPKFRQIQVEVMTSNDGCFFVYGRVQSQKNLDEFLKLLPAGLKETHVVVGVKVTENLDADQ